MPAYYGKWSANVRRIPGVRWSRHPPSGAVWIGRRGAEAARCGRKAVTSIPQRGVYLIDWDHTGPHRRAVMTDKSPRQAMTKKSSKSLKEKRADRRAKVAQTSATEVLAQTKKR
nr:hypothetical protein MFLOJ_09460 [Mycobacterium florentinum]